KKKVYYDSPGGENYGAPLCPPLRRATADRVNIRKTAMTLTVDIPDDLAIQLTKGGGDLSRRALEALAAEEYKRERLNKPELQRLLGIETSFQLDEFLKAHDVWIEYTREDAERERQSLERLGF